MNRLFLTLAVAFLSAGSLAGAQDLSAEQMATFLRTARVVSTRHAGNGITNSLRAVLTDGTLTHDAHVQTVDEQRNLFQPPQGPIELNFRDSYRYNIAAYHLARLLGMTNVPVSVERRISGRNAAVTWWVDEVQFDERGRLKQTAAAQDGPNPQRTSLQIQSMRLFDEIIQNRDRNQGNLLWTRDWTLWLVDHTRAFRLGGALMRPTQVLRCERAMCDGLRALTRDGLKQAMAGALSADEIDALLERRDAVLQQIDGRIARRGDALVLFTVPR